MNSFPKKLILIGGGGFVREVIWLAKALPEKWNLIGVLSDLEQVQDQRLCGIPVLGKTSEWINYSDAFFVVAIGASRVRRAVVEQMGKIGKPQFATLIHPSVMYSEYVSFGEGCIIAAGCILTTQIEVGNHTIIDRLSTIGHDTSISSYCIISPLTAVSGNVMIHDGVEIGTNSALIPNVVIHRGSIIGAGSVVTKSIAENVVAAGSPAREIRQLEDKF